MYNLDPMHTALWLNDRGQQLASQSGIGSPTKYEHTFINNNK